MVVIHKGRIGKTPSGGTYKQTRGKRRFETGRLPSKTTIGERKLVTVTTKGGGIKTRLEKTLTANILDPKTKKFTQAKIKTVKQNPANRHFVRENIITRGAVVETDIGMARVTSRPGQDGTVNAVLIS